MAIYIVALLKVEREKEWQNVHQYIYKNGEYKLLIGKTNVVKKPNIFSIELKNLAATHGEILVKGSISISFYNPHEYFGRQQRKGKTETIKIEIESPKDRYAYSPIVASINCSIGSDESGTFFQVMNS